MNDLVVSPDLDWSDEDEDNEERYILKAESRKIDTDYFISSDLLVEQSDLIEPDTKVPDYKRSFFNGGTKSKPNEETYLKSTKIIRKEDSFSLEKYQFTSQLAIPLPRFPDYISSVLELDILQLIWYECLRHGCDESELVRVSHIPSIDDKVSAELGYSLPFNELESIKRLSFDDYIEFLELITDLATHVKAENKEFQLCTPQTSNIEFPLPCCSFASCIHRHFVPNALLVNESALISRTNSKKSSIKGTASSPTMSVASSSRPNTRQNTSRTADSKADTSVADENEFDDNFSSSELFRLDIIYRQILHDNNGKIRIKHVFDICKALGIPYVKTQLPRTVLMNQTECLLTSQAECKRIIQIIRANETITTGDVDGLFKFALPKWLREEFKDSEIMLYEHHFMMIDKDGGGSIDADELQQLLLGFGTTVTHEQAEQMLNEYDMDGGGTIDFVEFMVLIYKIQRGTIDMNNSDLAMALMEAKSQLKIFEELEEVKRHPPEHCEVVNFGNTPITAYFKVSGPPNCMYANTTLSLQLIFYDGYPFRPPDIKILTRIYHINMLTQLDGGARLIHMKDMWSADWSIVKLLTHIKSLLFEPKVELLPPTFLEIYDIWYDKLYKELLPRVKAWRDDMAVYETALAEYTSVTPDECKGKQDGQQYSADDDKTVSRLDGGHDISHGADAINGDVYDAEHKPMRHQSWTWSSAAAMVECKEQCQQQQYQQQQHQQQLKQEQIEYKAGTPGNKSSNIRSDGYNHHADAKHSSTGRQPPLKPIPAVYLPNLSPDMLNNGYTLRDSLST